MHVLVTGSAGFIGFHIARRLLEAGHVVTGLDGMTPYYDVRLKRARHGLLERYSGFTSATAMLQDRTAVEQVAAAKTPEVIIHLAAQAGVRYSLENPRAYVEANIDGLFNIMEVARQAKVQHFLFASTSSVYGANASVPFRETDRTDHSLTLYAASKKAGEVMAHSYAHLWGIPTTCFRFFTVYGPWGRPDMAPFKFVEAIEIGRPIKVFNEGRMERDFTYIDDLVESIVGLISCAPRLGRTFGREGLDSLSPIAPYRVVNLGFGQPIGLLDFIDTVERALSKKAIRIMLPMQPGDVPRTYASTELLEALIGGRPSIHLEEGVRRFAQWYRETWRDAAASSSAN